MKRFLVFLLICCLMIPTVMASAEQEVVAMEKPTSVLVLGDSIADGYMDRPGGYMASAREDCYGTLIQQKLELAASAYRNNAVSGWRTIDLLGNMDSVTNGITAVDMVAISIGGNDVLWSLSQDSTVKYDIKELIANPESEASKATIAAVIAEQVALSKRDSYKQAVAGAATNLRSIFDYLLNKYPDTTIVIQTVYNPYDVNETLCLRLPVIENLNTAIKEVADDYEQVIVLDVFKGFATKGGDYICNDWVHPNVTGHAAIAAMYETLWTPPPAPTYMFGDINGDDSVTAEDALLALQAATKKVSLSDGQAFLADVDGMDGVTSADALNILQYATKKIDLFPTETPNFPGAPEPPGGEILGGIGSGDGMDDSFDK